MNIIKWCDNLTKMEGNSTELKETLHLQDSAWKKFENEQNEKNLATKFSSPIIYDQMDSDYHPSIMIDNNFQNFRRKLPIEFEEERVQSEMMAEKNREELQKKLFDIHNRRLNNKNNKLMSNEHQCNTESVDIDNSKTHGINLQYNHQTAGGNNRLYLKRNNINENGGARKVLELEASTYPSYIGEHRKYQTPKRGDQYPIHPEQGQNNDLNLPSVESADFSEIREAQLGNSAVAEKHAELGGKENQPAATNKSIRSESWKSTEVLDQSVINYNEQQVSQVCVQSLPGCGGLKNIPVFSLAERLRLDRDVFNSSTYCEEDIPTERARKHRDEENNYGHISSQEEKASKIDTADNTTPKTITSDDATAFIFAPEKAETDARLSVAEMYRQHRYIFSYDSMDDPSAVRSFDSRKSSNDISPQKTVNTTYSTIVSPATTLNLYSTKVKDGFSEFQNEVQRTQNESVTEFCNFRGESSSPPISRFSRDKQTISSYIVNATHEKNIKGRGQGKTEIIPIKAVQLEKQKDVAVFKEKELENKFNETSIQERARMLTQKFATAGLDKPVGGGSKREMLAPQERQSFACLKAMFEKPDTTYDRTSFACLKENHATTKNNGTREFKKLNLKSNNAPCTGSNDANCLATGDPDNLQSLE